MLHLSFPRFALPRTHAKVPVLEESKDIVTRIRNNTDLRFWLFVSQPDFWPQILGVPQNTTKPLIYPKLLRYQTFKLNALLDSLPVKPSGGAEGTFCKELDHF